MGFKIELMQVSSIILVLLLNGRPPNSIRIAIFGDLMMAGMDKLPMVRDDSLYPFRGTIELLRWADVAIANLESPIGIHGSPVKNKEFTFLTNPVLARYAKNAGFDGFVLANNHIMDYGREALEQTLAILDSLGIKHAGAGMNLLEARKPMIFEVKGLKIGILSYSNTFPESYWATSKRAGTAFGSERYVQEDVKSLRDSVDFLIVYFHWGTERTIRPKDYQKALAHVAIDAGADLVVGAHPHVIQGIELYRNRTIFYSLGNYAFRSATNSAEGAALLVEVFGEDSAVCQIVPLKVRYRDVRYSPTIAHDKKALETILRRSFCNFEIDTVRWVGRLTLPLRRESKNKNGADEI